MSIITRIAIQTCTACLFFSCPAYSQFAFSKKTYIPVTKGTAPMKFPWTGGFNNPQFSEADINNDGKKDLVVFDRTGDKTVTFVNQGTAGMIDYTYAPRYERAFHGFSQWMLMDDFDCDGVPDVFTYHVGAADYYKGRYTPDNRIEFDSAATLVYKPFTGGNIPIFISAPDIPAFADVNGDGDLDVLSFGMSGQSVHYYENQSIELTGTCGDTVFFMEYASQWGNFIEPGDILMRLDSACGTNKREASGTSRDGVHSLMAFDEDGDGDKELIIGSFFYESLNRLVNCGTKDTACICEQDPVFPSYDKPYKLPIFPASFYADVNNDGLRDLLAAPNSKGTSENHNCIWLYENTGTANSVIFHFISDTFLIDQTLDFGEGAYPAFFDYNADGLLDLVVGNYGYYVNGVTFQSGLALLENVGTLTSPSFRLVDRDYANVSSFLGKKAIYPAFGDMDSDGDTDMIVGEVDGFLHYFRNDAGAGNPASFTLAMVQMFGIDVGQFSAPFIYDVNNDSLPDLIVGEKGGNGTAQHKGEVNYFENAGTKTNFRFDATPTNDIFGEIDVRIPSFPNGYCTPVISTLDSTNVRYVLSGSDEGTIKVYEFDSTRIYSGSFIKRFNAYSSIDEGEKTAIAIADLNHDGKMEMVVGNYRGGLAFYSQSDTIETPIVSVASAPPAFDVTLFPNPSDGAVNLRFTNYQPSAMGIIELFDCLGKMMWAASARGQPHQSIMLPPLMPGLYFLKLTSGGSSLVKKLVIKR